MSVFYKNIAFLLLLFFTLTAGLEGQNNHGHLLRGDRQYDRKNYSEAREAYEKAAGPLADYNAGTAAFQAGDYDEAEALLRRAAESAPLPSAQSDAWYNLGNALMKQGKFAEAFEAYQKSLRRSPSRPDAKRNLEIARCNRQQPPPPEPPPPPPPPRTPPPRQQYLDQAATPRQKEVPAGGMPPAEAKRLLETIVSPDEQRSARQYRELTPSSQSSGTQKDW
ncbi:MAG: tetratricopeptide repeat protein [Saprospiraceae bacterium]